jgi:hypothetical protein
LAVGESRLHAFVSMRGTRDFGVDDPRGLSSYLYQGYVQYRRNSWDVRAGRQFLRSGVGARIADGIAISARLRGHTEFEAFASSSLDPFDPQAIQYPSDFLWAGARLRFLAGDFRVSPALQLDKRFGVWRGQLTGFDVAYAGLRQSADIRVFYDFDRSRLHELRLGYTLAPSATWRLPVRFQIRDPLVSFVSPSEDAGSAPELEIQPRTMLSAYPTIKLGPQVTAMGEASIVLAAGDHALRYGATLSMGNFHANYSRRAGHGPAEDRFSVSARRRLLTNLSAFAGFGISQYSLTGSSAQDERASFARGGIEWAPFPQWVLTGEAQVLQNPVLDHDARGYGRIEYRFGGGR